jgi:hypothetical protein
MLELKTGIGPMLRPKLVTITGALPSLMSCAIGVPAGFLSSRPQPEPSKRVAMTIHPMFRSMIISMNAEAW